MKYLLPFLLLPVLAFADPVTVYFTPPVERVDNRPLADSEITAYKYDAYGAGNTFKDVVFPNTGNMTEYAIDLPKDRYLICLFAKATYWSKMRCAYINMFEPKPPSICQ